MKFTGINMIKMFARENGSHFFDPQAMRFFSSRVSSKTFGKDGSLFITSEQFEPLYGEPLDRKYTVRRISETGSIDSVSEFQEFETLAQAQAFARHIGATL